MKQEEITKKVHSILGIALPGAFSNYADRIADYFYQGGKFYDMFLKINLLESQAEIFTQERGQRIVTYHTDNEDVVIYAILDDIIGIEAEKATWEAFANKDTQHMHYTDEVRDYNRGLQTDAFKKTGNPYDAWHKQGIGFFTLDKIC